MLFSFNIFFHRTCRRFNLQFMTVLGLDWQYWYKTAKFKRLNVQNCSLKVTQNFGSFVCWACGRSNCTEQWTWKRFRDRRLWLANIFLLAFFNKICRTWRTFLWNFDDSSAISKQNQNISQFAANLLTFPNLQEIQQSLSVFRLNVTVVYRQYFFDKAMVVLHI